MGVNGPTGAPDSAVKVTTPDALSKTYRPSPTMSITPVAEHVVVPGSTMQVNVGSKPAGDVASPSGPVNEVKSTDRPGRTGRCSDAAPGAAGSLTVGVIVAETS